MLIIIIPSLLILFRNEPELFKLLISCKRIGFHTMLLSSTQEQIANYYPFHANTGGYIHTTRSSLRLDRSVELRANTFREDDVDNTRVNESEVM